MRIFFFCVVLLVVLVSSRPTRAAKPPLTEVDAHAHVFKHDLNFAGSRRYTPEYDATCEDYLRHLDENGSTHGVLIQPSFLGTDNRFMLDCVSKNPDRLRAIAVVEPEASEGTLRELAAAGVVGIRLNLVGQNIPDFKVSPWPELLVRVSKLAWHVQVHREARDLPQILGPLLDAGVNVVVDHFGRYDETLGVDNPGFHYLLSTAKTGKVWVKLSAPYRNGSGPEGAAMARKAARQLLDSFGPERLVWGSDWPHTQFEKSVRPEELRKELDVWVPDPSQRRIILAETPARLYRF
jgi:predicted TIM-barrel fold metal-dependent hydrolase